MKKAILLFVIAAGLVACSDNNSASDPVEKAIDSNEKRADTLKDNVDSVAKFKQDSIRQWEERQKAKIDSAEKKREDSLKALKK